MKELLRDELAFRVKHNLTQGQFAKMVGCSVPTIVKFEHMQQVSKTLYFKIIKAIGKEAEDYELI